MDSQFTDSYDAVPYSSYPYATSHPRRMAAIGTLFGMKPPSVATARVLEIGCASGGNLLPMAEAFPAATFVGFDASQRQINAGLQLLDEHPLANVTLRRENILDFQAELGEFDFIICHGVYSWVPEAVQKRILAICCDHLSENGIAYVSYNTYPGWYLRRGVREMMNYHASGFEDPQTRIDQSRALLNFLTTAVASEGTAYEMLLHDELQILQSSEDSYLFHEHLEDFNEPLFFHEFIARAQHAGLRFLGESNFSGMTHDGIPAETRATLASIAPDIIRMEQYLDFLRNRKFRQTLLCHHGAKLVRTIEPERLLDLYVSSPLTRVESESGAEARIAETADDIWQFEHSAGRRISVASPLVRSAFHHLQTIWPREMSVRELAEHAWMETSGSRHPAPDECRTELAASLLECYSANLVDLYSHPAQISSEVTDTPKATGLTRTQAQNGGCIANQRHMSVNVSEFDRQLISRLDGRTRRDSLIEELVERLSRGELVLEDNPEPTREDLAAKLDEALQQYAQAALLVG